MQGMGFEFKNCLRFRVWASKERLESYLERKLGMYQPIEAKRYPTVEALRYDKTDLSKFSNVACSILGKYRIVYFTISCGIIFFWSVQVLNMMLILL